MNIRSSKVTRTEKWVSIKIRYNKVDFEISIRVIDGKVDGDYKSNMATSYITYFNETPDAIRKSHFSILKRHVEENYKN